MPEKFMIPGLFLVNHNSKTTSVPKNSLASAIQSLYILGYCLVTILQLTGCVVYYLFLDCTFLIDAKVA